MRISDWSSDVCSSDLGGKWGRRRRAQLAASERTSDMKPRHDIYQTITAELAAAIDAGAGQWRMPWHHDGGTVMRTHSAVGRAYTGIQRLVLWASAEAHGFQSRTWSTYRPWTAVRA